MPRLSAASREPGSDTFSPLTPLLSASFAKSMSGSPRYINDTATTEIYTLSLHSFDLGGRRIILADDGVVGVLGVGGGGGAPRPHPRSAPERDEARTRRTHPSASVATAYAAIRRSGSSAGVTGGILPDLCDI